ncbi:MAG TPA: putative hydro-lyase [bacterium]|nr:putative hydro-lyase [bacterium]
MSLLSDVKAARGATPAEIRRRIRSGEWQAPTAGLAPGYAQANLVVVPGEIAYDFLVFCQRNPKPCPLIDVTDPGSPEPAYAAPGADLRTDVPRYRVYRRGILDVEETEITRYWRADLVAFLLGCSFTFESAMEHAGLPVRHISDARNVPMYVTAIPCRPAGVFHGPMVVSMRPLPREGVSRAVLVTGRYTRAHGAPVHIGDPAVIGIRDLARPEFGDPPRIEPGEVPVYWACGVTPQAVAQAAGVELMITHAPGHMFITDLLDEDLAAG